MRFILLLGVAALLIGWCIDRTRTAEQFAFLEIGMPMTVVSNRVGMPDLPYRGQIRWRYSLADRSEMVIIAKGSEPDYSFGTWRVVWFGQSRRNKWLWVKPPE